MDGTAELLKGATLRIGRDPATGRLEVLVSADGKTKGVLVGEAGGVPPSVSRCVAGKDSAHLSIQVGGDGTLTAENLNPHNLTFVGGVEIISKKILPSDTLLLGKDKFPVSVKAVLAVAEKAVSAWRKLPPKAFDISPLEAVWDNYHDRNAEIQEKAKRQNLAGRLPLLFTMVSGVIRIHAAFEENNTAYYVMDYIEGESLAERVRCGGSLGMEEALRVIRSAGEALEYVHRQHINHLDVKPANVMVRRNDGRAVLIDFGLSKRYDSEGNQTSTTPIGISHGYAPLEQYAEGGIGAFSPESDVYSLAATLYFLVSGIAPPHATSLVEYTLPFPDGFPAPLMPAIEKAISSTRKNRYPSVSLFLSALQPEDEATEIGEAAGNEKEENPVATHDKPRSDGGNGTTKKSGSSRSNPWAVIIIIGTPFFFIGIIGFSIINEFYTNSEESIDSEVYVVDSIPAEETPRTVENDPVETTLGDCLYSGETDEDGRPHGHGIAIWEKGEALEYDGNWVHGDMDGEARYTLRNGDTFVGTFKDNRYEEGRYTIKATGECFEGTFEDGQPYTGTWHDKHGHAIGTLICGHKLS